MAVQLNHTIVWCHDNAASAAFLARVLGRPEPVDFMEQPGEIALQHYAFLVGEAEFDAALDRIKGDGLSFWADPARSQPGKINHHFEGRGVYFQDPNGHLLELITRPYGIRNP